MWYRAHRSGHFHDHIPLIPYWVYFGLRCETSNGSAISTRYNDRLHMNYLGILSIHAGIYSSMHGIYSLPFDFVLTQFSAFYDGLLFRANANKTFWVAYQWRRISCVSVRVVEHVKQKAVKRQNGKQSIEISFFLMTDVVHLGFAISTLSTAPGFFCYGTAKGIQTSYLGLL